MTRFIFTILIIPMISTCAFEENDHNRQSGLTENTVGSNLLAPDPGSYGGTIARPVSSGEMCENKKTCCYCQHMRISSCEDMTFANSDPDFKNKTKKEQCETGLATKTKIAECRWVPGGDGSDPNVGICISRFQEWCENVDFDEHDCDVTEIFYEDERDEKNIADWVKENSCTETIPFRKGHGRGHEPIFGEVTACVKCMADSDEGCCSFVVDEVGCSTFSNMDKVRELAEKLARKINQLQCQTTVEITASQITAYGDSHNAETTIIISNSGVTVNLPTCSSFMNSSRTCPEQDLGKPVECLNNQGEPDKFTCCKDVFAGDNQSWTSLPEGAACPEIKNDCQSCNFDKKNYPDHKTWTRAMQYCMEVAETTCEATGGIFKPSTSSFDYSYCCNRPFGRNGKDTCLDDYLNTEFTATIETFQAASLSCSTLEKIHENKRKFYENECIKMGGKKLATEYEAYLPDARLCNGKVEGVSCCSETIKYEDHLDDDDICKIQTKDGRSLTGPPTTIYADSQMTECAPHMQGYNKCSTSAKACVNDLFKLKEEIAKDFCENERGGTFILGPVEIPGKCEGFNAVFYKKALGHCCTMDCNATPSQTSR